MAKTLFLSDSSTEIIFNENPTEEFARIIRERLGKDAENMFASILEDDDWRLECVKDELSSYESSLEAAENVLRDIEQECDYLDFALKQTRVDRKEAQKAVDRIKKEVESVL